jgi:hypothetical protein
VFKALVSSLILSDSVIDRERYLLVDVVCLMFVWSRVRLPRTVGLRATRPPKVARLLGRRVPRKFCIILKRMGASRVMRPQYNPAK